MQRVALSGENDFRRFLLTECLEAYSNLNEEQRHHFQAMLETEQYREAKPLMVTTYERGKAEGIKEGMKEGMKEGKLEGLFETALLQLETRFGPLQAETKNQLQALAPELLRQVLVDLIKSPGKTLSELLPKS